MKRTVSLTFLLFLALSITGLALHQTDRLQPAENLALRLIIPLQSGISSITTAFSNALQSVQDLGELRHRNERLQSLVNKLMVENVRLKEIEAENKALLQLLDFTQANPSYEYQAAEVIGRDPSNLLRCIFINAGARHGLEQGMPVVTERGLVGRVTEVSVDAAEVLLITDVSSSVNALIQGSRAIGIIEGQVGGGLIMKYIPQGEVIQVGDMVITSGLGGNFPKKLVIGQITAVLQWDFEMFQQAEVRPAVDFNKLESVLVITNFQPIDFLNREWGTGNGKTPNR